MGARKKLPKTSKAIAQKSTSTNSNGSKSNIGNGNSEKPARKRKASRPRANTSLASAVPSQGINRSPLVEEEKIERCEIVDFGTTNTNIIQQLRLITAYPFIVDEGVRKQAMEAIREGLGFDSIMVRLQAAMAVAKMQKVNLDVFKQLASDQVQRHLAFDRQDEGKTEKQKALESMSDEELEILERMAEKMGGSISIEGGK